MNLFSFYHETQLFSKLRNFPNKYLLNCNNGQPRLN